MKSLGPSLTMCQLATWAEHVKKLDSISVIKMEEKTQQTRGGNGMGDTIKTTCNVGSVNENLIQT